MSNSSPHTCIKIPSLLTRKIELHFNNVFGNDYFEDLIYYFMSHSVIILNQTMFTKVYKRTHMQNSGIYPVSSSRQSRSVLLTPSPEEQNIQRRLPWSAVFLLRSIARGRKSLQYSVPLLPWVVGELASEVTQMRLQWDMSLRLYQCWARHYLDTFSSFFIQIHL